MAVQCSWMHMNRERGVGGGGEEHEIYRKEY